MRYLKKTVKKIYGVLKSLAKKVEAQYPQIKHDLPEDIFLKKSEER